MWFNKFKLSVCLGTALAIGAPNVLAARPTPTPATPPAPYVIDANGIAVGPLVPSDYPAAALYRIGTERIKIMFEVQASQAPFYDDFSRNLSIANTTRLVFADSLCSGTEVYLWERDSTLNYNPAISNEYNGYSRALIFRNLSGAVYLGRVETTAVTVFNNYPTEYYELGSAAPRCRRFEDFYLNSQTSAQFYSVSVEPLTFQAPFTIK
jgi:hypothetical protein